MAKRLLILSVLFQIIIFFTHGTGEFLISQTFSNEPDSSITPSFNYLSDSSGVYHKNLKIDTSRVAYLNNLALEQLEEGQEGGNAIYYANQALTLSNDKGDRNGAALSLQILGKANQKLQKYPLALDFYLQSLKEYEKLDDDKQLFSVNREIGSLYNEWGVKEKAAEYYLKSYALIKEKPNTYVQINLLQEIGSCYLQLNNYEKAIEQYLELLSIYEGQKKGNRRPIISTLRTISDIYLMIDQHSKSIQYDLRILNLYRDLNDSVGIANSLNNIGFLYKHLNQYEIALTYFKQALALNRKLNTLDEPDISEKKILMNIGIIYYSMGEYRKSLKYHFEALQIWVNRGTLTEIAEIYNKIALNYLKLKDYDKAVDYAQTAVTIAQRGGDKEYLASSYKKLSEIYQELGEYSKALSFYQLYAEIKDKIIIEQSNKHEELLQKQYSIEKKENDLKLLIAEKEMKDLELNKLQLETEKREQEIALLKREKELQEITLKHQQSEREKAEQALALAKNLYEVQKKDNEITVLQKNDSIKSLALKQKELEEKERQKDIALLKQQRANQELILDEQRTLRNFFFGAVVLLIVILFLILRGYNIKKKVNRKLAKQNLEIQYQKDQIEIQRNKIQQSYDNVKLLSEIAKNINTDLSVEKIVETVYENVNAMMDATAFGIGIYNSKTDHIEIPGAKENGVTIPNIKISVHDKNRLAAISFLEKKEIMINNLEKEYKNYINEIPSPITEKNASSIIYVPLVVKDKPIGIISVQSFKKNAYTEYHLNILRNLAVHIAIAVENARAYKLVEDRTIQLENTLRELRSAQDQLIQAEKMASLGQLTAGIAHEINNPINFVYAGVDSLKASLEGLLEILDKYEELDSFSEEEELTAILHEVKSLKNALVFKKTTESMHEVVNAIREGASRTAEIVKGLRYFSRLDESELKTADIHSGLDNTLILLTGKIKTNNIIIEKDYDPQLPQIKCYPGQLNQVFMNILSNAIDAINGSGSIRITTRNDIKHLIISISDTGNGIPEKVRNRIFEPFFTTKETGKGTGLGLSITFGIIEKHKGKVEVKSEPGKGTEFIIQLPKDLKS